MIRTVMMMVVIMRKRKKGRFSPSMAKGFPTVSSLQSASMDTS